MAKKGGDNKHVCRESRRVHIPADIRVLGNAGNHIASGIAAYIRTMNSGELYRRAGIVKMPKG